MVQVHCKDSKRPYNIHQSLLTHHAPNLGLPRTEDGTTRAIIDTSFEIFKYFAEWAYQSLDHDICAGGLDHSKLWTLLEIHELGRTLESVDFMDQTLDAIIDGLPRSRGICYEFIIKAFAQKFPPKSGGWNFATDCLLSTMRGKCAEGQCIHDFGLDKISHKDFMSHLTAELCVIEGFKMELDPASEEFCNMLVHGYFEVIRRYGDINIVLWDPWREEKDSKCKYHTHTEQDLPCYSGQGESDEEAQGSDEHGGADD